jgi:hypothetical protein
MKRVHRRALLLLAVLLVAAVTVMVGPTAAQDDGEIDIAIEPESSTVQPGEERTYEVVVEGPDSGVGAYDGVVVDLSDPTVGDIVGFEETFDETSGYSNSEIRNNNATLYLEAFTADSFATPGEQVVIATFDLQVAETAADDDTTNVEFDPSAPQTVADFESIAPYDVAELRGAGVTVSTAGEGEIELAIEPETSELGPGESQTYEVIVRAPDSGISAYEGVVVNLSDPTVGDIVGFEETFDETSGNSNSEIRDNNATLYLEASTADSFAAPAGQVVIATFDLVASETVSDGDTTGVVFDPSAAQTVTDFEDNASYSVVEFEEANMTVDVESPPDLELVSIDAPEEITIADDLEVEYTIENQGDVLGTESAVELVIDIAEPTVEDVDTDVAVGAGDSVTGTLVYGDVGSLAPGVTIDYTVQLDEFGGNRSGTTTIAEGAPEATISNLSIAGQGAEASISEGQDEPVSVDITNTGTIAAEMSVSLVLYNSEFEPVLETEQSTEPFDEGETGTVTFEGVTGELGVGEYTVELVAGSAGTDDDGVFGDLSVTEPESSATVTNLDIAGQGAEGTVVEGTASPLAVDVTNVGAGASSFDVVLEITAADGERAALQGQSTAVLAPGETEDVVFDGVTQGIEPGAYVVTVESSGVTVSGNLTVVESPDGESLLSNLDIAGQGPTATLLDGESADVTVAVTNVFGGNETFEPTLQVDNGTTASATTGPLEPGESETVAFTDVGGSLETGQYDVVIAADSEEVTGSLTVSPGVDVTGDGNLATDTTGDGLLNDVDGNEEFDIFDVQALFTNLGEEAVQSHPGLFNFDDDPSGVDIFDVQALFGQLP